MNNKNITIITISIISLGAMLYYYFNKKKNNNISNNNINNSNNNNLENINTNNDGSIIIDGIKYFQDKVKKASYISENPDKKELVVHFASPRPDINYIKKFNPISLVNFGKYSGFYTVNGTWKDDAGNLGAIYLTSNKITNENKENREFENKGLIVKLLK